jgi:hypothetical protein
MSILLNLELKRLKKQIGSLEEHKSKLKDDLAKKRKAPNLM